MYNVSFREIGNCEWDGISGTMRFVFFFFRLPLLALVYHSDCQMGIGWLQGSTRRVYCYPSQWTIDQLECKCKGEACEDVNVEQDLVIRPNQVRLPRTPAYGTISDAVRCDIPND